MIVAGIILISLQAMALISSIARGVLPSGLAYGLGFYSPGIVGIVLLVVGIKKRKKKKKNTSTSEVKWEKKE